MESGRYKNGVTLVEILVVVALIMLLATMVVGIATRIDNQSKEKALEGTFALLEGALQEYYDFADRFPEPNAADDTTVKRCEKLYRELYRLPGSRKVLEQISDKLILNRIEPTPVPEIYDLWGTVVDYRYNPGAGDSFPELISAGPDKTFDTGDDITNR